MKKIVSTQGFLDGTFDDQRVWKILCERVNQRIEYAFDHCRLNKYGEIHIIEGYFSYTLLNGIVTSITISYLIDSPSKERLDLFRDICNMFFTLDGFMVDDSSSCVLFKATDEYDMACLLHALESLNISLVSVMHAVDEKSTTRNAVHSLSDTYADEVPESDDEEGEPFVLDEHHVGYSIDGKRLLFTRFGFDVDKYEVCDGVEEIADFAFMAARRYLVISIPRSVKLIGGQIFGIDGGHIEIRDV